MRKRITMLLMAGILPVCMLSAQSPSKVAGEMKISSGAQVHSSGSVQVDMSSAHGTNGKILNEGTLNVPNGIIFASDDATDGMVLNKSSVNHGSTPSLIKVIKRFETGATYYSVTFPFDVKISEIIGETETLVFDEDYFVMEYLPERRALYGYRDNMPANEKPWVWIEGTTGLQRTLKAGVGYLIYPTKPLSLVFPASAGTSTLFHPTNPKSTTLTFYHSTERLPVDHGWNFIGNMQKTSFNLNSGTINHPSVGYAYFYDREDDSWSDAYDLDPASPDKVLMAPFTGFFVQTAGTTHGQTSTLSFLHPGKTLDQTSLSFRSSDPASSTFQMLELKLQKSGDTGFDKLRVIMDEKYSDTFVIGEDAVKMLSAKKPQFYTMLDGSPIIFNKMRPTTGEIPLGVILREAGEYTIGINNLRGFEGTEFYLVDKKQGRMHNLSNGEYTFNSEILFSEDRYVLRTVTDVTAIETGATSKAIAYSQERSIHIANIEAGDLIAIYNLSGQLVVREAAVSERYSKALPAGVYLVKATGSNTLYTAKIINK